MALFNHIKIKEEIIEDELLLDGDRICFSEDERRINCCDNINGIGSIKNELDIDIVKEEVDELQADISYNDINELPSSSISSSLFDEIPQVPINKIEDNSAVVSQSNQEPDFDGIKFVDSANETLEEIKAKAKVLYNALMECETADGRKLIFPFLENPLKEFQPHYYEVIKEPMDMKIIKAKITKRLYFGITEVKNDFLLMFSNAQKYHEQESRQVYLDAHILRAVLFDNWKKLNQSAIPSAKELGKGVRKLYRIVREYRDEERKKISTNFLRSPSRIHFPDYYEIIKQPIDFEKMELNIAECKYSSIQTLFSDLKLLFQNVCRYNEPLSQIYRDALTLQNISIQNYLEICRKELIDIDARDIVHNMIMSLFICSYNVQSLKGKYITSSFTKLPIFEELQGQRKRILSFDVLKCRLDKGLYTRLDHFQQDFFSVLDKARDYADLNSRLYTDTITLQKNYLVLRDTVFRHNSLALLKTKAFDFTQDDLIKSLEIKCLEKNKLDEKTDFDGFSVSDLENDSIKIKKSIQLTYSLLNGAATSTKYSMQCSKGEFVYLRPESNADAYRICFIERAYTDDMGRAMLYGNQYYRPQDTNYNLNQKFYEQEVFKTEKRIYAFTSEIVGKCLVLSQKTFHNFAVVGMNEKDIYVCLNKYNINLQYLKFSRLKYITKELPKELKLVQRDVLKPLILNQFSFSLHIEQRIKAIHDLENETMISLNLVSNIVKPLDKDSAGNIFYLQFCLPSIVIKLGDFVYIQQRIEEKSIFHISRIFVTKLGKGFMVGLKYLRRKELPTEVTIPEEFIENEVYFTTSQEVHPLDNIVSRCSVLSPKDYATKRCTDISEKDVYLCRRSYAIKERSVSTLENGIFKYALPTTAYHDEIYFFIEPTDMSKFQINRSENDEALKNGIDDPAKKDGRSASQDVPQTKSTESNDKNSDILVNSGHTSISANKRKKSTNAESVVIFKKAKWLHTERPEIKNTSSIESTSKKVATVSETKSKKKLLSSKRIPVDSQIKVLSNNMKIKKKGSVVSVPKKNFANFKSVLKKKIINVLSLSKKKTTIGSNKGSVIKSVSSGDSKITYSILIKKENTTDKGTTTMKKIIKVKHSKANIIKVDVLQKKNKLKDSKNNIVTINEENVKHNNMNNHHHSPFTEDVKEAMQIPSSFNFHLQKSPLDNGTTGDDEIRAYMQFVLESQDEIESQHMQATCTEIAAILSTYWNLYNKEHKSNYNSRVLSSFPPGEPSNHESFPDGCALFYLEMRRNVRIHFPEAKICIVFAVIKTTWARLDHLTKLTYQNLATLWQDNDQPKNDFCGFSQASIDNIYYPLQTTDSDTEDYLLDTDLSSDYFNDDTLSIDNNASISSKLILDEEIYTAHLSHTPKHGDEFIGSAEKEERVSSILSSKSREIEANKPALNISSNVLSASYLKHHENTKSFDPHSSCNLAQHELPIMDTVLVVPTQPLRFAKRKSNGITVHHSKLPSDSQPRKHSNEMASDPSYRGYYIPDMHSDMQNVCIDADANVAAYDSLNIIESKIEKPCDIVYTPENFITSVDKWNELDISHVLCPNTGPDNVHSDGTSKRDLLSSENLREDTIVAPNAQRGGLKMTIPDSNCSMDNLNSEKATRILRSPSLERMSIISSDNSSTKLSSKEESIPLFESLMERGVILHEYDALNCISKKLFSPDSDSMLKEIPKVGVNSEKSLSRSTRSEGTVIELNKIGIKENTSSALLDTDVVSVSLPNDVLQAGVSVNDAKSISSLESRFGLPNRDSESLLCNKCFLMFTSKFEFEQHLESDCDNYPIRCSKCSTSPLSSGKSHSIHSRLFCPENCHPCRYCPMNYEDYQSCFSRRKRKHQNLLDIHSNCDFCHDNGHNDFSLRSKEAIVIRTTTGGGVSKANCIRNTFANASSVSDSHETVTLELTDNLRSSSDSKMSDSADSSNRNRNSALSLPVDEKFEENVNHSPPESGIKSPSQEMIEESECLEDSQINCIESTSQEEENNDSKEVNDRMRLNRSLPTKSDEESRTNSSGESPLNIVSSTTNEDNES